MSLLFPCAGMPKLNLCAASDRLASEAHGMISIVFMPVGEGA